VIADVIAALVLILIAVWALAFLLAPFGIAAWLFNSRRRK
jgi:hypothetical protein